MELIRLLRQLLADKSETPKEAAELTRIDQALDRLSSDQQATINERAELMKDGMLKVDFAQVLDDFMVGFGSRIGESERPTDISEREMDDLHQDFAVVVLASTSVGDPRSERSWELPWGASSKKVLLQPDKVRAAIDILWPKKQAFFLCGKKGLMADDDCDLGPLSFEGVAFAHFTYTCALDNDALRSVPEPRLKMLGWNPNFGWPIYLGQHFADDCFHFGRSW